MEEHEILEPTEDQIKMQAAFMTKFFIKLLK